MSYLVTLNYCEFFVSHSIAEVTYHKIWKKCFQVNNRENIIAHIPHANIWVRNFNWRWVLIQIQQNRRRISSLPKNYNRKTTELYILTKILSCRQILLRHLDTFPDARLDFKWFLQIYSLRVRKVLVFLKSFKLFYLEIRCVKFRSRWQDFY